MAHRASIKDDFKLEYYACGMSTSTTRMMILGLVIWMQPVHGYDVRRELLSWNADNWEHRA